MNVKTAEQYAEKVLDPFFGGVGLTLDEARTLVIEAYRAGEINELRNQLEKIKQESHTRDPRTAVAYLPGQ